MRMWLLPIACLLAVSACTNDAAPVEETTTSTSTEAAATSTTAPASQEPCLSGDLAFEPSGLIAALGEAESDATRISQIRWEAGTSCERLVIGFTTDTGAPATALGLTGVTVIESAGVVRVDLPDEIATTAIADSLTDGLIRQTYVVRDDEGLLIDLHGRKDTPIAARAFITDSPASLVVDVIVADSETTPVGASISDVAVVVSPPSGPALFPFTVEAYARPGAPSIHVLLTNNDVPVTNLSIALPAWTDTWQALATTVDDGPSGRTTLFVGTVDASDNPAEGAEVVLDLP